MKRLEMNAGSPVGAVIRGLRGEPGRVLDVVIRPGVQVVRVLGCAWVRIRGGEIRSDVQDKVDVQDSENVLIEGVTVNGGGTGVSVQRCRNVEIRGVRSTGLVPVKSGKTWMNCEGVYVGETTGLRIEGCVLENTGWPPATVFNHGMYINGACDGVTIVGNVVRNASSTGIQARAGGYVADNLIEDCAIGLTYALVNGNGPQKIGGCSGVVEGNVVRRNRRFSDQDPLGQGVIIGANCYDVRVRRNVVAGDTVGVMNPWQVEMGRGDFAGDQIGIRKLRFEENVTQGFKKPGTYIAGTIPRKMIERLEFVGNKGMTPLAAVDRVTLLQGDELQSPEDIRLWMPTAGEVIRQLWPVPIETPPPEIPVPSKPVVRKIPFKAYVCEGTKQVGELKADGKYKWGPKTTIRVDVEEGTRVEFWVDGNKVGAQVTAPLYMWGDDVKGPLTGPNLKAGAHSIQLVIGEQWYRYNVKVVA